MEFAFVRRHRVQLLIRFCHRMCTPSQWPEMWALLIQFFSAPEHYKSNYVQQTMSSFRIQAKVDNYLRAAAIDFVAWAWIQRQVRPEILFLEWKHFDRFQIMISFSFYKGSALPYVIYAITDSDENMDIGNRGFALAYTQNQCPVL